MCGFHWPKEIYPNEPQQRAAFLNTTLRANLNSASDLSCDLASYSDKEFHVDRLYSGSVKNTPCKVIITLPDDHDVPFPVARGTPCDGDGTVPVFSGSEGLHPGSVQLQGNIWPFCRAHSSLRTL